MTPRRDTSLDEWLNAPLYWMPPRPAPDTGAREQARGRRARLAQSALVAAAVAAVATAGAVGPAPATAAAHGASERTDQFPVIAATENPAAAESGTGMGGPGPGVTHTVEPGDTLYKIAQRYGVPLQAVIAANNFPNPNLIYPGQSVTIPGADAAGGAGGDGLTVEVQRGDTVWILANRYGVSMDSIIQANKLANPHLIYPGQTLTIPGVSAPAPAQEAAPEAAGGGNQAQPAPAEEAPPPAPPAEQAPAQAQPSSGLIWPAQGRITQQFGPSKLWMEPAYQGYAHFHQGLDIANKAYTPIVAAAAGTVTFAGWSGGYGYMVQIDHGNGLSTLYAHMAEQPYVRAGQWVEQGQQIGPMGSTGASTGSHLHFAVKQHGVWQDPLNFLP
ncbi:MAG: LysM peptidoglycan-binding domain-containing M23 family metallopeptidase [Sphaerobacter sp.]|nr:LysM peptidoglycan-binding domain-containing M23 family metallopeptidase [Sphaerobacter sp.]